MSTWCFADVWDAIAGAVPDRPAQIQGGRSVSWAQTARRAAGVGGGLTGAGLDHQDKVALYLYNAPEYLESVYACVQTGLVPVNTNYRYGADELHYLWDDADVCAVVFHGAFTATVDEVRRRQPDVRLWVHVDDGSGPCPSWAVPYEQLANGEPASHDITSRRSGEDLILIYTGGTTGRPKGVMWRQHDLYCVSDTAHDPAEPDLDRVRSRVLERQPPVGLAAAPLMHGTGFVFAASILSRGGTLISQVERRFDAEHLLDLISEHRVTAMCIVGEAFARPLVDALDAQPDRWDLSSLTAVSSAGMVWRAESKQRLLVHAPNAKLVDFLNSSEASGMASSVTSRRAKASTGSFRLGANSAVLDAEGRPVEPGSGAIGRVAVSGHLPLGYYKDPEKTARTFPVVEGVRYSFPGDHAIVEADGSITLVGRGSGVVNTGGEKVYPEEVEEVLRSDPSVRDVIVVGIPDQRMGEIVACVVEPVIGVTPDIDAMRARAREQLAAYKVPRQFVVVDGVPRTPSGKADYTAVRSRITGDDVATEMNDR